MYSRELYLGYLGNGFEIARKLCTCTVEVCLLKVWWYLDLRCISEYSDIDLRSEYSDIHLARDCI